MVVAPPVGKVLGDNSRRPFLWLTVLALLLAIQINPWWNPVQDGVNYLSIARNVAHGRLERFGSPYIRYAPGYPICIAPAFWFSDQPFLLISIFHWLMAVFFMLGVYFWAKRYLAVEMALLLTGLSVLNAGYWHLENLTLSETLFVGLFWWAAWALDRLVETRRLGTTLIYLLASVLLVCAASLTRQVGVLLLCGLGLRLLSDAWKKRMNWSRAVLVGAIVTILPVVLAAVLVKYNNYRAVHGVAIDHPYSSEFRGHTSLPMQIITGLHRQISETGQLLLPGAYKLYSGSLLDPNLIIYIPIAGAVLFGWWKFVRQTADVMALTMPFYVGLYVVWPFDQQTRFLMPLLPLGFISLIWMFKHLDWTDRRIWIGILAAHFIFALAYFVRDLRDTLADHRRWAGDRQIAAMITSDRSSVTASVQTSTDDRLIMEYWVDRPIPASRLGNGSFMWWIIKVNQTPPAGYTQVCKSHDIILYHADFAQKIGSN